MKLDFELPTDGQLHRYCWNCRAETVTDVRDDEGRLLAHCSTCNQTHERSIIIDPQVAWGIGDDGEYIHHTASVVVISGDGRILLFYRTKFPFAWTLPAGHIDVDELADVAAGRELREETGLEPQGLQLVTAGLPVPGDACRRGSDLHQWTLYVMYVERTVPVEIQGEGTEYRWCTLQEALGLNLTVPVRLLLTQYGAKLTIRH
ncbi:MAG TPA: NUDIX hydrolase [Candidatus Saccharimonas sp.]|nr:NUDIX hydrolase [Candidatus Saccharimonas sp.]